MPTFRNLELVLALPEYRVPLPGGRTSSQNDIFALGSASDSLVSITVEGKVDEVFDRTLEEWLKDSSEGKKERLKYLSEILGINLVEYPYIRYQLVHRTASALILAKSFHAKNALMLVHSFSQKDMWFDDYRRFVDLFGGKAELNSITRAYNPVRGINLYLGWVKGAAKYLDK